MRTQILKTNQIIVDKKIYPRESLNNKVVKEYTNRMKLGDKFPPIYIAFFKKKYYLVDGNHRLESYLNLGDEFINCEVKTNFINFNDIFLASVRANLRHGHRLNRKDREKIKNIMIEMKFDANDISKLTGLNLKQIQDRIEGKIKNKFMNKAIGTGKIKSHIRDIFPKKENIKIINEKEAEGFYKENKDEYHYKELTNVYKFLKEEQFNYKDKEIKNLLKKIKKQTNKWRLE